MVPTKYGAYAMEIPLSLNHLSSLACYYNANEHLQVIFTPFAVRPSRVNTHAPNARTTSQFGVHLGFTNYYHE